MAPPACAWCSSAWVDLVEMTGDSMTTKATVDPLINSCLSERAGRGLLNGGDPCNPLAAPHCADLHSLPPMLVPVGSARRCLTTRCGWLAWPAQSTCG